MSATVSYKGNTITTITNETKTLNTAGTWLEGNIIITDESSGGSGITIVDTVDSHGGIIRTITGEEVRLQTKTITPTSSQQVVTPDSGYMGFSSVTVEPGGTVIEEITVSSSGAVSQTLQPDKFYHFTSNAISSLTISLAESTGQYHFDFSCYATAITLALPQTVNMPASFGVEAYSKYEIDILNNQGVYAVWINGGS